MRILPVLDLLGGEVVRATAGRRRDYRPVVSTLTASSRPLDVAQAFRAHFGLTELYLADLDAILGDEPAFGVYSALAADGFRLWIDAGVHSEERPRRLAETGVENIIIGLETVAGPGTLEHACGAFGDRIVFSLDLKGGMALGNATAWESVEPTAIAARAVALGVGRMIVLDLAQVGVGGGVRTEGLCGRLAAAHPDLEVIAAGGVRDGNDLRRLRERGVRGALVASALHDGRLTRAHWEGL